MDIKETLLPSKEVHMDTKVAQMGQLDGLLVHRKVLQALKEAGLIMKKALKTLIWASRAPKAAEVAPGEVPIVNLT